MAAPAAAPAAPSPSAPVAPVESPAYAATNTADLSIAGLPSPRRRRNGCLAFVVALGLVVALGSIGAFAYWRYFVATPDVVASVGQDATGEVLRLELGGSSAARVRMGGAERPVQNGRAELPLPANSLHLGENQLAVELVDASGAVTAVPVTLTVQYRVRADLGALGGDEPALHVLVEALPGASVTLAGQPVALDAEGRGRVAVPLAQLTPAADGSLTHVAPYVVTSPDGTAQSGSLTTRLPIARLELARPLDGAVTDLAVLDVLGEAQPGTTVTIEGQTLAVDDHGTFHGAFALPTASGDAPVELHLTARREGAAPRTTTVHVRRVPSLDHSSREVPVDASITYDQLVASSLVGRTVAFEGEVYNVDVHDGRGIVQMLARGCSRDDRCPLWVTYAPAAPIENRAVVRVVGVVAAPQEFRAESGDVRTVPHIDATYVVPLR